jgi:hypothetical protein
MAACDNCDPKVGCKTGTVANDNQDPKTGDVTVNTNTNNNGNVHVKDVEPDRHNNVIGMWVSAAVCIAVFIGVAVYMLFIVKKTY